MKVGDIVVVHDVEKCKWGCVDSMLKYKGKIGKIMRADRQECGHMMYYIDIDCCKWSWCDNTLKLYNGSKLLENE